MSEGDGMVTDEDRAKAMDVMGWSPLTYESFRVAADEGNPDDIDAIETVDAIAAALAEEREKARAPFVRLADEIQAAAGDRQDVVSATMRDDAALIRATLDDN